MSKKNSKYKNKKITVNGVTYDSLREYRRHRELLILERAGIISDLRTQVTYELIPSAFEEVPTGEKYRRGPRKGELKTKKVCIERSVDYIADFVYTENGNTVVEDAKGKRTKEYIIKKKLMLWVHGIKIQEV